VSQLQLPTIQITKEVNGLEMGVLSDGTVYLSQKALAKLCGVANSSISDVSSEWGADKKTSKLAKWLVGEGVSDDSLFRKTELPGVAGNTTYAYGEDVSKLILEYYAFEVENETAKQNYRVLGRAGLRAFVYHQLGYDPANAVPISWRHFHDRLLMASAPAGYFSVFKEIADFVIAAIRGGLPVDHNTVPDISVGKAWSACWEANGFTAAYGERIRHDHNYPSYFPQAISNPQEIWVYPVKALGEFRLWMQNTYVPQKFPTYLKAKVAKGILPASAAQLLIVESTAGAPKQLPPAT
jgi:hypothetical protein